MAGRHRRKNSTLSFLYDKVGGGHTLSFFIGVFFTVFALLFALSGIAIWPVVIKAAFSESVFRVICRNILICDGVLLLLYIVLDGIVVWCADNVTFGNILFVNLALGGLINMVVLLAQLGLVTSSLGSSFMLTLLWLIFSFLATWVLTLLPAAIIAGVANMIYGYLNLLVEQER